MSPGKGAVTSLRHGFTLLSVMETLFEFLDEHLGLSRPMAIVLLILLWFAICLVAPVFFGFSERWRHVSTHALESCYGRAPWGSSS